MLTRQADGATAAKTGRPARPGPRRRLLWGGLLALLLLAGGGLFAYFQVFAETGPVVRSAEVTLGDLESTVTSLGTLQPKDYVDVGAQVSGQLKVVHFKVGQRVEKGELLAEIDATVLETRVRTGKANLENLRAQLAQQRAQLALSRQQRDRNRNLFKSRVVSEDALQSNETQVKVVEAQIAAIEAQIAASTATLDGDTANLGYSRIYAPFAGTVVSQTAVQGQTLNANQTAPIIARVADLDVMTVSAQVAEADVVKVKEGMPVYFTTLGLPARRWHGQVRQVMPTPEVVNDVVLYNVLVDVDNTDGVLMTRMTAQVFFVLGEAKDVPLVPVGALRPVRGRDAEFRVRVLTAAGEEQRTVKVGLMNRNVAEVVSGLAVGERVVINTPEQRGRQGAGAPGGPRMGARL